jgi:hypothetical protein
MTGKYMLSVGNKTNHLSTLVPAVEPALPTVYVQAQELLQQSFAEDLMKKCGRFY